MAAADPANPALAVVRSAARSVTRLIAGETLIVPVADGVADLEAIFTLNPVGSRIWELLEPPVTYRRLVEVVAEEYDVSPDEAARDVADFVEDLRAAGLIESVEEEG